MLRRWLAGLLIQPLPAQAPPSTLAIQEQVDILHRAFKAHREEVDKALEDMRAERARVAKALQQLKSDAGAPASTVPNAPGSTIGGPEVPTQGPIREDRWTALSRARAGRAAS